MEGLRFSYLFVIHFSTLCTNTITLLDDDGYDILSDAIQKGETLPYSHTNSTQCKVHDLQVKFHLAFDEVFDFV